MSPVIDAPPPAPGTLVHPAAPQQAPPKAPQPKAQKRKGWRVLALAEAALLLGAAVAAGVIFLVPSFSKRNADSASRLVGPPGAAYKMHYPRTWKPLSRAQLSKMPGQPLAVLRRRDGRGTMIVSERAAFPQQLAQLPPQLKRSLSRRFTDFRQVGAKVTTLNSSPALIYTFARAKTGIAQSLVIVPGRKHSFTLNAVVPPRSPDVAREVGAMISTFQPNGDR